MPLLAEFSDVSPEQLKFGMLFADLINGFFYQISNLVTSEARTYALVATLLPGLAYILGAFIYIIVALFTLWDDINIFVQIPASISTAIGLTLYLIADNFYLVEEIRFDSLLSDLNDTTLQSEAFNRINSIQPMLLVLAIIFFRAIPFAIGLLTKDCGEGLEHNSTDSIYVGIFDVVVVTIEFDSWFTLIQTMGDCSRDHLIPVWFLWAMMVLLYAAAATVSGFRGLWKNDDKKSLSDAECGTDVTCGILLIIFITIAFGIYLLSDNSQPLACYPGSSGMSGSSIRLAFVILSFVTYFVCTFVFAGGFIIKNN